MFKILFWLKPALKWGWVVNENKSWSNTKKKKLFRSKFLWNSSRKFPPNRCNFIESSPWVSNLENVNSTLTLPKSVLKVSKPSNICFVRILWLEIFHVLGVSNALPEVTFWSVFDHSTLGLYLPAWLGVSQVWWFLFLIA